MGLIRKIDWEIRKRVDRLALIETILRFRTFAERENQTWQCVEAYKNVTINQTPSQHGREVES